MSSYFVDPLAEVSPGAHVGDGTRIWRYAYVREGARIGDECNIGSGVYVDAHVHIGARVKIQNHVSVYEGVTLEDGVFVGPHACFANDMYPRAITVDGALKSAEDWSVTPTLVKRGASIGAHAVIRCGVTVGEFALVGSGSVVTHDVPPHAMVFGNPARVRGYVCYCARPLAILRDEADALVGRCDACGRDVRVPLP